jgi:hypothetical protein
MKANPEGFINVDAPEFLILEVIDNNIEHLRKEIKRMEHLKEEVKYELEYGDGWSISLYQLLQRL